MSRQEYFTELIQKFISGSLTEQENHALMRMLDDNQNDAELDRIMRESFEQSGDSRFWTDEYRETFANRLMKNEKFVKAAEGESQKSIHRIHFLRTTWFKYAAAVLIIIIGAATYRWTTDSRQPLTADSRSLQTDIAPGGDRATLTLADGSEILLDSAANGTLADQGGVQVLKLASGQIAYDIGGLRSGEVMWNTMSTPKGGQYQVTLPDGTRVWLNASSSIMFPTAFAAGKREVKITGEVYLEVAKDKEKPFVVDVSGKSSVEVLGTSFNINAYADESSIRTTLVEGSVKVAANDQTAILKPGQQALIAVTTPSDGQPSLSSKTGNDISVNPHPDLKQVLAWKNGVFDFTGADLKTVMRQLERWYDIQVEYKDDIPSITFEGRMYRNVSLRDVLEALQDMGVQFELNGKNLVVH